MDYSDLGLTQSAGEELSAIAKAHDDWVIAEIARLEGKASYEEDFGSMDVAEHCWEQVRKLETQL